MKVLIISSTVWDVSNSFGNTFSNLFSGIDNLDIYNICCRNGENNNSIVKKAVQITDKSVLRSIYKRNYDPCWIMDNKSVDNKNNGEVYAGAKKSRRTIYFILRDLIWKLGGWKKSKVLNTFLDEIKPDILYLPIYHSQHISKVQQYVIDKLNVPVVGHISDNVYDIPPSLGFIGRLRSKSIRKKVKKLISHCSYLEVFAETMAHEYAKMFSLPCYVIGKGIDVNEIPKNTTVEITGPKKAFVYTGNINKERFCSLLKIGKALQQFSGEGESVLKMYSASLLTKKMIKAIDDCPNMQFCGKISKEEVARVQQEADYLVHVEGFGKQAIFEAGMSFSTKIIDYMSVGKPIFAVGSEQINSIRVLSSRKAAIVANSEEEVESKVADLFSGKIDTNEILHNASNYLLSERDVKVIQSGIKERMDHLFAKLK